MKITPILIYACLATACATQPIATPSKTVQTSPVNKSTAAVKIVPSKNTDAIEFLNFAETFSNLPIDSQKQTLLETNQVLAVNPNDLLHRMKLVMIYGLPSSNLPDTAKAQQLLQKIMQEDILANSQLALANLLFDHLSVVNKPTKTTNSDPKRLESLQQKNEALQQKLEATQQKLEAAQQKLDELKKIEKSMGERDALPKK
jgi:predicted O-linked N-acetylglucosamine transferase (SPINDLY family)